MSCDVCRGYDDTNCPCCGEDVRMITCPDCKGTGEEDWQVFDVIRREFVDCTKNAYLIAAENEDIAELRGQRYCKYSNVCQTCKGEGEIPENY